MKKLLLLLLITFNVFAQPKRKVLFDADTTTRPDAGFYGVGIRDSQPYLVRSSGDNLMFDVYPTKVAGWQFNNSGIVPTSVRVFTVNKDSLTIDLPDASDTLNRNLAYTAIYLGYSQNNDFSFADNTYLLSFSDTIFVYNPVNGITYWTQSFYNTHTYSFFKVKPFDAFCLYVDKKRWWLSAQNFKY